MVLFSWSIPQVRRGGDIRVLSVAESPLGRVPKQNPDKTISSEGRPINDMRLQNSKGSKFNHPPAPQPRHQSVARQSLWWHARHPGVPQRCAKRDVPRAFKWHFLRPSDVSELAVKLAGILVISLVMPFGVRCLVYGSTGSPQGPRPPHARVERHRSLRVPVAHGRWGCP